MAPGDLTLINHGSYFISGAAIKTAVDGITLAQGVGAFLHIIPLGEGRVQVIEIDSAAS